MSQQTSKPTTEAGYRNRHGQIVLCDTGIPGTDYGQRVYLLQCDLCGHLYGSNGSDIFERKCPEHQKAASGVPADLTHVEISRANLETVCYQPGHVYRDSAASTKKADDEFLRWFDASGHSIPNSGGVRWRDFVNVDVVDSRTRRAVPAYFVLVTVNTRSQFQKPWHDEVGVSEIVYHGDAKYHRRKEKYDDFYGNQRLEAAENARSHGTAPLPPVLHFTKFRAGWVQFNGLCLLRRIERDTFNDSGHKVENLIAHLTILDAPVVPVRWLRARALSPSLENVDRIAPIAWQLAVGGTILSSPTPHLAPEPALMNREIALSAPKLPGFQFDSTDDEDARERAVSEICRRRGQPQFRQQLLYHYDRRCAISGCTVVELLEACHIKRYMGPRTNHPSNGILLRADLHTLFDLGLIAIDTTGMSVVVAPALDGTEYASFRGQRIRLPASDKVAPNIAALNQHRSLNFDGRSGADSSSSTERVRQREPGKLRDTQ